MNNVNKDHYTQRGRLTPDELARERARQVHLVSGQRRFNQRTKPATGRRGEQAPTPERNEPEEQE
jgi:hypothetical protein